MKVDASKIQPASFLTRFVAAIIDFGLVIVLSVFSSMLIYYAASNSNGKLKNSLAEQNLNISSSHLAKQSSNQYVTYTSDEYFKKTETGYQIIDSLSYFYTVYLAGNTEKASTGDVVSVNADQEMDVNGEKVTPRNYYSIAWFNQNVLELPLEGQTAKYDYFIYQKNGEENDYTKVGTVNPNYIKDGEVEASKEMTNFIYDKYKEAVNVLYGQSNMVKYSNYVESINSLISFITRMVFVLVFFEILPLCLKRGKSLGKLLMKLSLVKPDGEDIYRWQVIPRGLLVLAIPLILFLIQNIFIQIGMIAVLFFASMILYLVKKDSRMVLHDLIEQTVVVEDSSKNPKE